MQLGFRLLVAIGTWAAIVGLAASESNYPPCLDQLGDCDWYPNCLEKEYKCGNDSNNYPMAFAYPVCAEMVRRRDEFSEAGQKWIDGVRMCLQEKIAPDLKSLGPAATCKHAEELAFRIHYDCYIENGYCDITQDWLRIFNIVKFTIVTEKWQVVLTQGLSIVSTCLFG